MQAIAFDGIEVKFTPLFIALLVFFLSCSHDIITRGNDLLTRGNESAMSWERLTESRERDRKRDECKTKYNRSAMKERVVQ